ncbi:MAG: hypothetical protein EOO65_00350 [Methanosarcinales archaeon]|nr:MAG: hypothetical protein EOO65_00350 [Methanosarcinales archaeon]
MTPFATLWLYAVGVLTAVALALSLVAIVLPPTPNACVEFPDACASVMVPLHRRPAKHDLPPAFQALVSIPRLEQYRLTRLVPGVSDRAREHGDASGGNEAVNAPPALPILFVHGHRGSPDQGSALATLAANLFESADDELPGSSQVERAPFVVYSIDFDEASSAFHSTELATQAYFINECVLSVLNLHPNAPQHVVVVAHSMGGIAARIAFLMPNHVNGSVSTLITLATPHQEHPYNIDSALHSLFQASNQQWALLAAGASDDVGAAQGVLTAPASLLSNVVLVSLAGGPQVRQSWSR